MTPFGQKMRQMRASRGIALKTMAHEIGVSPAYLSALEHGRRGKPTWYLVQKIISYFNVIWDEAEELERLAEISDPKVSLDTAGLSPAVTQAANIFARSVSALTEDDAREIMRILDQATQRPAT
ncbi:MAG: helix-turn-helix domain-containing protein [Beijerinckiaceae bacterium]